LLAGKPIITVVACRNMWAIAHEKMKNLLSNIGARLIDNVVLTDRGGISTFITTPIWLLTGRKGGILGLPAAGITRQDIEECDRFGVALAAGLITNQEREAKPMLAGLHAVEADPRLIWMERMGHRSFRLWGRVLRAIGPPGCRWRSAFIVMFAVYLALALFVVAPISIVVSVLLGPLLTRRMEADKAYFEAPSGSSLGRMHSKPIAELSARRQHYVASTQRAVARPGG